MQTPAKVEIFWWILAGRNHAPSYGHTQECVSRLIDIFPTFSFLELSAHWRKEKNMDLQSNPSLSVNVSIETLMEEIKQAATEKKTCSRKACYGQLIQNWMPFMEFMDYQDFGKGITKTSASIQNTYTR